MGQHTYLGRRFQISSSLVLRWIDVKRSASRKMIAIWMNAVLTQQWRVTDTPFLRAREVQTDVFLSALLNSTEN